MFVRLCVCVVAWFGWVCLFVCACLLVCLFGAVWPVCLCLFACMHGVVWLMCLGLMWCVSSVRLVVSFGVFGLFGLIWLCVCVPVCLFRLLSFWVAWSIVRAVCVFAGLVWFGSVCLFVVC